MPSNIEIKIGIKIKILVLERNKYNSALRRKEIA